MPTRPSSASPYPVYTFRVTCRATSSRRVELVEFGDAIAAGRALTLKSVLFRKDDQTRVADSISFAELRHSPAILIGDSWAFRQRVHRQCRTLIADQDAANESSRRRIRLSGQSKLQCMSEIPHVKTMDLSHACSSLNPAGGQCRLLTGIHHYAVKAASNLWDRNVICLGLLRIPARVAEEKYNRSSRKHYWKNYRSANHRCSTSVVTIFSASFSKIALGSIASPYAVYNLRNVSSTAALVSMYAS